MGVIAFIFISCENKKPILDGFGNLKIGMSLKQFDDSFRSEKEDFGHPIYTNRHSDTVKINPDVKITNVLIRFANKKLLSISCDSSKQFFNLLKRKYGIKISGHNDKVHYTWFSFNTNSKDIECVFESRGKEAGFGIHDLKTLRKLDGFK